MDGTIKQGAPAGNGRGPRARIQATRGAAGRSPAGGARARGRRKRDKTALVLGGGGFTGAVYEIGALRALSLLAGGRGLGEFDVYVGTSAGSFVSALCAARVSPGEMMQVLTHEGEQPFREMGMGEVMKLNLGGIARRGLGVPAQLISLGRRLAGEVGQASLMDLVVGLAELLPAGLYSGAGIERYLKRILREREIADDFRRYEGELYIVATDLDSCERVVFGSEGFEDVPISRAVRASCALPMVYSPVKVGERELVDGAIMSTTNLDIAVEAGAKLVVVINPIVPFVNDFKANIRTLGGVRARRISDMGFSKVGYQAFKLLGHRRLHMVAQMWEERYPGTDIVLVEPDPTDEIMFQTSIMDFGSRVEIAKHGFESVARKLAGDYERYREVMERHGIEISPEKLRRAVDDLDGGDGGDGERRAGWRRLLAGTTSLMARGV